MAASGKWIEGLDAQTPIDKASRRSLEPRLTIVAQFLPLAAHLAEHDIEHRSMTGMRQRLHSIAPLVHEGPDEPRILGQDAAER